MLLYYHVGTVTYGHLKMTQEQINNDSKEDLYEALLTLKTTEEIGLFLQDICTPMELDSLADRWMIARILSNENSSYREINAKTGISTTTIGRVARFLQQERHQGYHIALDRIKE